jgi:DNA ligase-1
MPVNKMLWLPTLAASLPVDADLSDLPYPLWVSPKIDGFRAMIQRGVLVSRNGLPVLNKDAQARWGHKEYEGLDGEITDGPPNASDVFNRTSRVVRKADADGSTLQFNVIDYCGKDGLRLADRIGWLQAKLAAAPAHVYIIPQTPIENVAQLRKYEEKMLSRGYEGCMLRAYAAGSYMQKRSTLREFSLVKLKRFDYGEARLLAVCALKHNLNSEKTATGARSSKKGGISTDDALFGSVTMQDVKSNVEFSVSIPGDVLRAWPGWRDERQWKGKIIRYKFFPTGIVSAPRFPTAAFEELR